MTPLLDTRQWHPSGSRLSSPRLQGCLAHGRRGCYIWRRKMTERGRPVRPASGVVMGGVRMSRSRVRAGRWVAARGDLARRRSSASRPRARSRTRRSTSRVSPTPRSASGESGPCRTTRPATIPGVPPSTALRRTSTTSTRRRTRASAAASSSSLRSRDDSLANNRQEVQGLLDDNVFAALPMTTSLFSGADLLVSDGIPTFRVAHQRRMGIRGRQPGPAQPVRSKRIVPQPQVSGSQLLRRRLAGAEAQQDASA